MNKEYYRKYYDFERSHWWFRARAEILRCYIQRNVIDDKPLRILNVGAATGYTTTWLSEFGEVVSLEYDEDCIDFVKNRVDFEIERGSILALPYSENTYDIVCCFDVIEHVEDDRKAVHELCRVCKRSGAVLLTVPAGMDLWSQHDIINHHFRRYDRTQLEGLFTGLPGQINFISFFNSRLYPLIYLVRKASAFLSKIYKRTVKSDFETFKTGMLNSLFYMIMVGEKESLSRKRAKSSGVSILFDWRKS